LEWCEREAGVYTVADQSTPETQRAYFARAIAQVLPDFAEVTYPDWERLFATAAAAAAVAWVAAQPGLDRARIFVFGHSMGGVSKGKVVLAWTEGDLSKRGAVHACACP
jgi:alpha-beta hydrolase superfamily lysophospholipase